MNIIYELRYGSWLYGTNNANSDIDIKQIYMPDREQLLLSDEPKIVRKRFDKDGNDVEQGVPMPPGGIEYEIIPIHRFVQAFFSGEAYALEMAFACKQGLGLNNSDTDFKSLVDKMIDTRHKNVYGSIGFALKQTMDYVLRADRYEVLTKIFEACDQFLKLGHQKTRLRDTVFNKTLLEHIAEAGGLTISQVPHGGKMINSVYVNGRTYLDSTSLWEFSALIEKLKDSYGKRAIEAVNVDFKSLMHAVRVYEQIFEYMETGVITLPRPNKEYLKSIREGNVDLEVVRGVLRQYNNKAVTIKFDNESSYEQFKPTFQDFMMGEYFAKA